MAERILMNEYKTLSKEPWTNIEVIPDPNPPKPNQSHTSSTNKSLPVNQ